MSGTNANAYETKPRIRVQAGSDKVSEKSLTQDSFVNFQAGLGYGAANITMGSSYQFNPVTRNHIQLDYMYRGSWIIKQVIDAPAEDMTRAGVLVDSDMDPEDIDAIHEEVRIKQLWQSITSTIKWGRLYGGALAYIQIEGQDPSTPLRLSTVGLGQFKGLMVMDRWMVWASVDDVVVELGPDFGKPKFYTVVADARGMAAMRIHHSRVIRFDGVELPYYQSLGENGWGLSVVEPMYDRLIAYDSVSLGAAQLVYKAHLRVMSVDKLRELIAAGGRSYQAFLQQMQVIRMMQINEGLTVIDSSDKFEVNQYAFSGLSDLMNQFGQQLSGASMIPLTRLFGQSPNGMSATGESDLRTYYDGINAQQESKLRIPFTILFDIVHRSLFGKPLPKGFGFSFKPLWLLSEQDRTAIATNITTMADTAVQGGLIGRATALKEMRQSSRITGIWSNITDEDIQKAEQDDAAPPPADPGDPGDPPQPGMPTQPQPGQPPSPTGEQQPPAKQMNGHAPSRRKKGRTHKRGREIVALLYPNTNGLTRKDIMLTTDELPFRQVQGLNIVIETEKGHRRVGHGWSVQMPCDYGYISGTSSEEGANEQFDCFLGPNPESNRIWVIEQMHPGTNTFDEYKAMVGFSTKQQALECYLACFDDSGSQRLGRVMAMSASDFRTFLKRFPYHTTMNGKPNNKPV